MDIVQKIQINAEPETIYLAITSHQGIEGWWAKHCHIADKVGGITKVHFTKEGQTFEMHFRIDELDKNKKVVWTCLHNSNPAWLNTHISFEINGHHKPAEVIFKHTRFDAKYDNTMETQSWTHFMNSLKKYCETGLGEAWG